MLSSAMDPFIFPTNYVWMMTVKKSDNLPPLTVSLLNKVIIVGCFSK